jgi:hypothetical protein
MPRKDKGRNGLVSRATPKTFNSQNHTARRDILMKIADGFIGNGAENQRRRIMAALRRFGNVSTLECSRYLSIVHPPRRIMELRRDGYGILTAWQYEHDEQGRLHRVGRYVLEARP